MQTPKTTGKFDTMCYNFKFYKQFDPSILLAGINSKEIQIMQKFH